MRFTQLIKIVVIAGIAATWFLGDSIPRAATPAAAPGGKWLGPQDWRKIKSGPVIALGAEGAFDDMHIFAPTVTREGGQYRLWYPGSRGTVAGRIFRLGLATSRDGVEFTKSGNNPVYDFGNGRSSVVTPTILRELNGKPIREDGKLRMWFTAVDFSDGLHTLHETTSDDGEHWSAPSPPQIENAYAPTVIKDDDSYGSVKFHFTT
jgi:hypothetical protein